VLQREEQGREVTDVVDVVVTHGDVGQLRPPYAVGVQAVERPGAAVQQELSGPEVHVIRGRVPHAACRVRKGLPPCCIGRRRASIHRILPG